MRRRFGAPACWVLLATSTISPALAEDRAQARFDRFEYSGAEPGPAASADEYHNPVLQGFYPDPSIIRVGRDYYLANSTFAYFPGIPIFHSRDLVNWTQIGNAIDRPEQVDFTGLAVSEGMFAPSISERAGRWYMVNVCVQCGGNFVITARDPAGPWSKPIFIKGLDGAIDPSLFFDDDGSCWIVYNGLPPGKPDYDGHRAIWLQRFDTLSGQTTSTRTLLVDGGIDGTRKPVWIEGPHIFKKDGTYYLIAAEGGTGENHSEVVLRSRSVGGPYLPGPANPILTQRDLPAGRAQPVTSAGHSSFVQTQTGQWWAVFLATRPYGGDDYNTGRETFMLPVTWREGWPQILPKGMPIPSVHRRPDLPPQVPAEVPTSGSFTIVDRFDRATLAPYWMMLRTPGHRWFSLRDRQLVLEARAVSIGSRGNPSFLARRQQHANAWVSTAMHFVPEHDGARAGLVAFQNEADWYFVGLVRHGSDVFVELDCRSGSEDPVDGRPLAARPFRAKSGAPLFLKAVAHGNTYDFYYGYAANRWTPLKLGADGTLLSTRRAGGFVGAMLGLYAYDPQAREGR